jgi:hypothetical protein
VQFPWAQAQARPFEWTKRFHPADHQVSEAIEALFGIWSSMPCGA